MEAHSYLYVQTQTKYTVISGLLCAVLDENDWRVKWDGEKEMVCLKKKSKVNIWIVKSLLQDNELLKHTEKE